MTNEQRLIIEAVTAGIRTKLTPMEERLAALEARNTGSLTNREKALIDSVASVVKEKLDAINVRLDDLERRLSELAEVTAELKVLPQMMEAVLPQAVQQAAEAHMRGMKRPARKVSFAHDDDGKPISALITDAPPDDADEDSWPS